MRTFLRAAAAACALAMAAAPLAAADPGGVTTDDPAGEPTHGFLDGEGYSTVEPYLGGQPAGSPASRRSRNLSLLGSLKLDPFNAGVHGDVAGYRNLAFIGKWREACPGTGVDVIDISRPAAPVKLADTEDHVNTSMEDMQAVRTGGRDVLVTGLQDCRDPALPAGRSGLEIIDISNPRHPRTLSFFDVDRFGADAGGVHEVNLAKQGNRVLALLSVPDLEALSSDEDGLNGAGDLLIVDITDPEHPTLTAEWGVLDEPLLGLSVYLGSRQGADGRTQLHSVRANANGRLAYLSYWDAGVIMLDISDPSHPVFRGRTTYPAGAEGNAHSTDEARGGNVLVQADEDFSPFHLEFTSSAFSGLRPAVEAAFTPLIVDLPGRQMTGTVVHVGRGCPAGSTDGTNPADPYLADPAGRIALVERGACRFDNKIARAQLAGATGVIVYNNAAGGEALVLMGGIDPVLLPDGTSVDVAVPAVFVGRGTGLAMRDAPPPVTASARAAFDGWGFLRFFDVKDPAAPVQLSTFATPHTNDESVGTSGTWSVHNPQVRGSTVYASWYSDGVRAISISDPSNPREIGFWAGAGAPSDAPAVNIWGVALLGDLVLASDRNYGLYVLRQNAP